jgi:hypothetical protein
LEEEDETQRIVKPKARSENDCDNLSDNKITIDRLTEPSQLIEATRKLLRRSLTL